MFDVVADGGAKGGASYDATRAGLNLADTGGGTGRFALFLVPSTATLVVQGSVPTTANFRLEVKAADGRIADVTPDSVEFDRPDLGTVSDGQPLVLTAPSSPVPYGGTGRIHAVFGGKEATATVTVRVRSVDYGPGLDATSPSVVALEGASLPDDPAASIRPLLYPYDRTVWPLGLASPLLMWNAPRAGDVYRVHYEEADYELEGFYTLGSLPGQLRVAQELWDRLTASNEAAHRIDPLSFSLYRWDSVSGKAYKSVVQSWVVAPESLQGAIYYWTASKDAAGNRVGHITKFQPGTGAAPVVLDHGTCLGCHAVNARGTVLVADVDDGAEYTTPPGTHTAPSVAPYDNWSGTRPWAAFDLNRSTVPEVVQTTKFGADVALTPDGQYVVFGGQTTATGSRFISLGIVGSGAVVTASGLDAVTGFDPKETNLMMPAFSPDGTKLAVVVSPGDLRDNVLPTIPSPNPGALVERIAYLDFDRSGPTFLPTLHPVTDSSQPAFVTSGPGLAYPSFSPDSNAVAFHAGSYSTGCNAQGCDDSTPDNGDLFVADLATGSPVRLATVDDPPNVADRFSSVEPTFNPVPRGGYSWVVFTSMRAYGNQPWPSDVTSLGSVNGKRRLWVAAINRRIGATDPSHPAIYLDGQADTPNMRGFWTLAACIATPKVPRAVDAAPECTAGFQCCSGFCEDGTCRNVSHVSCAGAGGFCSSSGDCCNSGVVGCVGHRCAIPPPK